MENSNFKKLADKLRQKGKKYVGQTIEINITLPSQPEEKPEENDDEEKEED